MLSESVHHAVRALRRDWRTTLLAAGLLAVTIGTVMAIFAIVDAVLLRPLPVADQDRVVVIWQRDDRRALADHRGRLRRDAGLGEAIAVVRAARGRRLGELEPDARGRRRRPSRPISPRSRRHSSTSWRVRPLLGRGLAAAEDVGMQPRAMVISHGLWQRRFGGDPSIVGRATPVKLDDESPPVSIDVVGVMPPELRLSARRGRVGTGRSARPGLRREVVGRGTGRRGERLQVAAGVLRHGPPESPASASRTLPAS